MGRRKRKVEAESDAAPVLPCLTQEELLRLRLLSVEQKLAEQEAKLATVERHSLIAKLDPKGQLAALELRLARSARAQVDARQAYSEHLDRVSTRLGVDLRQGYLIDPDTGAATLVEKKD